MTELQYKHDNRTKLLSTNNLNYAQLTSMEDQLRCMIISSLQVQGYEITEDLKIKLPVIQNKEDIRNLHHKSVAYMREKWRPRLEKYELDLIDEFADGDDLDIQRIKPQLELVSKPKDSLIFNYISCHWSIPVSAGYGRRLRYIVRDTSNNKIMGIIGLGDPVYALEARDQYIGWDSLTKKNRLYNLMDAYLLGAVPPYNQLLCGKLMALLTLSDEVRNDFHRKYVNKESLISGKNKPADLVLITTSSALGKSSVYDRLKCNGIEYWNKIGVTKGTGDFQFSTEVYDIMKEYVKLLDLKPEKNNKWGTGIRNKREVIRKCLKSLGLKSDLMEHGIKREIFVAPTCSNSLSYLRGETDKAMYYKQNVSELYEIFKKRWLVPRSLRLDDYKIYSKYDYLIWNSNRKV